MPEISSGSSLQNTPMNRRIAIGAALVAVVGVGKIVTDQVTADDDNRGVKRVTGNFVVGQQVYPSLVFPLWSSAGESREKLRDVYYDDQVEIVSGGYEIATGEVMYEVRINRQHLGFAFEVHLKANRR